MGAPEDYDSVTISVSPYGLYNAGTELNNLGTDIINQLNTIYTTVGNLQLSWSGSSASEAQSFTNRLSTATDSLFGTQKNPSEGAFSRLVAGVLSAAQNYDMVDKSVASAFDQLVSAIGGHLGPDDPEKSSASGSPSSSSPNEPPPPVVLLPQPPGA